MKKRIMAVLFFLVLYVPIISIGCNCNFSIYPVKDYTAEELENGLLGVELIYIVNYDNGCNYDVISELSDNDVKYVTEKITQIHFVGYAPKSSEGVYGIKFCYKDESLVFEPMTIVRIDNSGEKVEGTEWFCMAGPRELMNLIDELVIKYK